MGAVIKAIVGVVAIVVGGIFGIAPLIGIGATMLLSSASSLLTKKPNLSAVAHDSLTRAVTVRQPISARRVVYGTVGRLGGVITFMHVEGSTGQFLHLVITLAGHQVSAINTMYFDGVAVPIVAGAATGTYAGFVTVEYNLGTATQAAFPNLVSSSGGKWTSAHQQKGRAGVHVRLKWDAGKFPNGVPNITFDIDGAILYDPRSNTTGFSNNAALCLGDYLTNTDYGLGAATQKATRIQTSGGSVVSKFIGDTGVSVLGQAYEGLVYVENIGAKDVTVADNFGHSVLVKVGTKANVYLNWTGDGAAHNQLIFKAPASGDSLDFLLFKGIMRRVGFDENQFTTTDFSGAQWTSGTGATVTRTQFHIASVEVDRGSMITAANICDEAVALNAGGNEARYTTNGVIDTSIIPADAISSLLTAMAGYVTYSNAVFKMYAGAYVSPTESISEGDLRGDIVIQTTRPKRDLFNGVKGLFVSPANGWQPTDFPPKQDATYLARDRGEAIWKDVELPFTTSVPTAQRLAKIDLQRNGRQISLTLPLKLSKYTIAPLDVINVSLARLGWVNKTFEVASVNLVFDNSGQQGYIIGVDVQVREIDASVYAWTAGTDEAASSAAQTVVLPDNANLSNLDNGITDGSVYGRSPVGINGQDGTDLNAQSHQNLVFNGDMSISTPPTGTQSFRASAVRVTDAGGPPVNGWTRNFESLGAGEGKIYQNDNVAASGWSSAAKILVIQDDTVSKKYSAVSDAFAVRSGINYKFSAAVFPGLGGTGLGGPNTLPLHATWYFRVLWYSTVATDFSRGSADLISFVDIISNSTTSGALVPSKVLQAPSNAGFCRIAFYHWDDGTATGVAYNLVVTAVRCTALLTSADVTALNTSGHATAAGGALSQSGVSGTILVASRTIQYGFGPVTYSAGSVSPGLGTWYVYADDPTYAGGAVTYVASPTESDAYASDFRVFFGKITLTGGGGGTSPNPPGTGGGRVPL